MWRIAFWIGVCLLVDAAIDLWGLKFWQQLVPGLNVRKIALWEALAGLFILLAYFLVGA